MTEGVRSTLVAQVLGENIRRARRRACLSQEQLGDLAGLHRTEIGKLEKGDRIPRADTLFKIAESCNLDDPGPLFKGLIYTPPSRLKKGTWGVRAAGGWDRERGQ